VKIQSNKKKVFQKNNMFGFLNYRYNLSNWKKLNFKIFSINWFLNQNCFVPTTIDKPKQGGCTMPWYKISNISY
jgi:hypothetical protein